ncbi:hypothetical protein [Nonomuraea sp. NPDC002799]
MGTLTDETLTNDVRALLRAGLPILLQQCGPALLELSGVRAGADDSAGRVRALDASLREQLDRLEHRDLAAAARLLFGADASTTGATLTARRAAAAAAAGYEVHHFRKRIEPKLAGLVAWQLRRASEEAASRAVPPQLRTGAGRPVLPADVFAWESAEHQQALATLWGTAYLLRAELLTVARLVSMDASGAELVQACGVALWRHAAVLRAARTYRAAYGSVLLPAGAEPGSDVGPDQIAASAGWTPPLTPTQDLLLAELADPGQGLADFTARLDAAAGGSALAAAWQRTLTGRDGGPAEETP